MTTLIFMRREKMTSFTLEWADLKVDAQEKVTFGVAAAKGIPRSELDDMPDADYNKLVELAEKQFPADISILLENQK
jgi:hypothetical protein